MAYSFEPLHLNHLHIAQAGLLTVSSNCSVFCLFLSLRKKKIYWPLQPVKVNIWMLITVLDIMAVVQGFGNLILLFK